MISTFRCYVTHQRLTILDYDLSQNNGRYRAVVNEDQVAVLQLQTVDTQDTPVSQLSLCPGVLETEVLHLLSESIATNNLVQFLIEKTCDVVVYR